MELPWLESSTTTSTPSYSHTITVLKKRKNVVCEFDRKQQIFPGQDLRYNGKNANRSSPVVKTTILIQSIFVISKATGPNQ